MAKGKGEEVMSETVSPNPVESPPLAPTQVHSKVGAGAIGAAFAVVFVWVLTSSGIEVPEPVSVAIGSIFFSAAGWFAKS